MSWSSGRPPARREWRVRGLRGGGGEHLARGVTPRSASATTSLIRRQLARTPQCGSMLAGAVRRTLHSVMPSGPSIASTISIRRDLRRRRARAGSRRCAPRKPATRPACASGLSSLADGRQLPGRARSASSAALSTALGRVGERGQDDGGVVGELGDAQHGGQARKAYRNCTVSGPREPSRGRAAGGFSRSWIGRGCGGCAAAAATPACTYERHRRLLARRQVGRRRLTAPGPATG